MPNLILNLANDNGPKDAACELLDEFHKVWPVPNDPKEHFLIRYHSTPGVIGLDDWIKANIDPEYLSGDVVKDRNRVVTFIRQVGVHHCGRDDMLAYAPFDLILVNHGHSQKIVRPEYASVQHARELGEKIQSFFETKVKRLKRNSENGEAGVLLSAQENRMLNTILNGANKQLLSLIDIYTDQIKEIVDGKLNPTNDPENIAAE